MKRRNFITTSAAALGSLAIANSSIAGLAKDHANYMGSFGFQSWTIRKKFNEDLAGTCKMMAGLGYSHVEMCSPVGYEKAGFAPLNKFSGKELRSMIEDNGLKCFSSHFGFGELRDNLDNRIEWSQQMGLKQMILASFWLPKEEQTLDNYRKSADELNKIAVKVRAAGMQMGYHNHNMEFEMRGDKLIYDVIMDELDPDLVKMQFQVAVISVGYKAADYFRKYPGRFISSHLSDWSKKNKEQVPIGKGVVDWKDFFKAAKVGGVQNIFVEMDPDTFAESARYLKKI